MISAKTIATSVVRALDGDNDPKSISKGLDAYLESHQLTYMLPSILRILEAKSIEQKNFETLKLELARELPVETTDAIAMHVGAEKAGRDIKINTELVGGFRAEYRGVVTDGSVKNQLRNLHTQLSK